MVLRGIINPSARASDGAGCGLINFREAASLAEPSSGRVLAARIGRPPPVSQIGSGLGGIAVQAEQRIPDSFAAYWMASYRQISLKGSGLIAV